MILYEYSVLGDYKNSGCNSGAGGNNQLKYYVGSQGTLTQLNSTHYIVTLIKTGLTAGTYYYNSTACDINGVCISTETRNITIAVPSLGITNVNPTTNGNITQNQLFQYTVNVSCHDADCGNISVYLDPTAKVSGTIFSTISADTFDTTAAAVAAGCSAASSDYLAWTSGASLGLCSQIGSGFSSGSWTGKDYASKATDGYSISAGDAFSCYDSQAECLASFAPAGKGLVNTTIGAVPFYTNGTNPINITLNESQSILVTFWVNATGTDNSTYEFYAYANITLNTAINNITNRLNLTISNATGEAPPSNDCVYSGSGDFYPPCNCNFSTSIDLGNNNIYINKTGLTSTGFIFVDARIYNFTRFAFIGNTQKCYVKFNTSYIGGDNP